MVTASSRRVDLTTCFTCVLFNPGRFDGGPVLAVMVSLARHSQRHTLQVAVIIESLNLSGVYSQVSENICD
jgi:hypothetical protein